MDLSLLIKFAITFISILSEVLFWAIFISVLMSWFASRRSPFGEYLEQMVQPILKPFRWARIGMIDLSPIVALFCINLIAGLSQNYLHTLI